MNKILNILCLTLISSNAFGYKKTVNPDFFGIEINPTPVESFFNIKQTNPASEQDFFAPHFGSHEITPEENLDNTESSKNNKLSYSLGNKNIEFAYERKLGKFPASFKISNTTNMLQITKVYVKDIGKKKDSDQVIVSIEENNYETLAIVSKGTTLAQVNFYKSNENGIIDYFRGGLENRQFAFTFRGFMTNAENNIWKNLEIVSQVAIGSTPKNFLIINKVKTLKSEPEAELNRKKIILENYVAQKKDPFKFYEKESGHRLAAMVGCNFLVKPNSLRVGAFYEYMSAAYKANCKEYNLTSNSSLELYGLGAFVEKSFKENTFLLNTRAKSALVFQNNSLKTKTAKRDIIFELTGTGKLRSFKPVWWFKTPEVALSYSQFLNTKKFALDDSRINWSLGYTYNF